MTPETPANPRALVTGAAQGIGRSIAASLLDAGMRVALLDRDADGLRSTVAELDAGGDRTLSLRADVSDQGEIDAALTELEGAWGGVDVLVNNAGVTVSRSVWEIEAAEWDAVMATNLRSYLLFAQRLIPPMREAGWGRVVNMASMAGQQGGTVAGAHYAASKAGIIVLTKILAREVASQGVTVNAVAPAVIRTPIMDTFEPERIAAVEATIPVGRIGAADDVGAMVAYLCSPAAGYVTGATLDINGGLSMR